MKKEHKSKQRVLDHLYWLAHSETIRSNEIAFQIVLDAVRKIQGG